MEKTSKLGDIAFTTKEMKDALKANADGSNQSYIGLYDEMVDFGEAESFIDESEGGKEFTLRITNNTSAIQKIQFNEIIANPQGYNLLREGNIVTVGTGNDAVSLVAEGDPRSIDILVDYIKHAPMRLRKIKFNVSDDQQLDEPIKYQEETPFKTGSTVQKVPSTFQDQNTNNVKTVDVEFKNWILGHNSTVLYAIRPGVSVNLTLSFGGALDVSNALVKKYKKASSTAAKYFARQGA